LATVCLDFRGKVWLKKLNLSHNQLP
jgi:hypothetical protein